MKPSKWPLHHATTRKSVLIPAAAVPWDLHSPPRPTRTQRHFAPQPLALRRFPALHARSRSAHFGGRGGKGIRRALGGHQEREWSISDLSNSSVDHSIQNHSDLVLRPDLSSHYPLPSPLTKLIFLALFKFSLPWFARPVTPFLGGVQYLDFFRAENRSKDSWLSKSAKSDRRTNLSF